jgi:hypothetical protein
MRKLLSIAALVTSAAFADSVTLNSITADNTVVGANYRFTYELNVSDDVRYDPLDFFTIYDFSTAIFAAGPVGWSATIQNVGDDPDDGPPFPNPDSPAITNVTFTNDGPGSLVGATVLSGFNIWGPVGCGPGRNSTDVQACSEIYFKTEGSKDVAGVGNGDFNGSEGPTRGPNENLVPEPATMGLMGGALLGLGFLARRRKQ